MELAGVAFARRLGLTPEDWARHLWSDGALAWMRKENPTASEYLLKEAKALQTFFPESHFDIVRDDDDIANLIFRPGGCAGGWGEDQWGTAHSLGLGKGHVCRYCREAFRSWSAQLGLTALPIPQTDGTCVFRVERPMKAAKRGN
jgi:hypothetical protein